MEEEAQPSAWSRNQIARGCLKTLKMPTPLSKLQAGFI